MPNLTMAEDWETAKREFSRVTKVKEAAPEGFYAIAFDHGELTKAIVGIQRNHDAFGGASDAAVQSLVHKGDKLQSDYQQLVAAYIKVLDREAKATAAEKTSDKATIQAGLKLLKAALLAVDAEYGTFLDAKR